MLVDSSSNNCMPRQMPIVGSPAKIAARIAERPPARRSAAAPNAPTPGSTRTSVSSERTGSVSTTTAAVLVCSALVSECRLQFSLRRAIGLVPQEVALHFLAADTLTKFVQLLQTVCSVHEVRRLSARPWQSSNNSDGKQSCPQCSSRFGRGRLVGGG